MSDFEIPPNISTSIDDDVKQWIVDVNNVNDYLKPSLELQLKVLASRHNEAVRNLTAKYELEKKLWIDIVTNVYEQLMTGLKKAFEDKTNITINIQGVYDSTYQEPSREYWIRCNPKHMMAIQLFIDKLLSKGYNPQIEGISQWSVDRDDGMYYGGHQLIITCKLF